MMKQLILFLIIGAAIGQLLETKPQQHIEIEIGQAYDQTIPLLFKRFQHSKLIQMKRDVSFYQKPICQIRQQEPGLLRHITVLQHNTTAQQHYNSERIVYKFQQLRSLRVFTAAVQHDSMFIALYQPNQVTFYRLNEQNGFLDILHTLKIDGQAINNGQFVISQSHILLFTSKAALKINLNSSYQQVQGFKPVDIIDDIQAIEQYIYIGVGNKGIITYKYNATSQTLQFISNTTFFDQIGNETTSFDANKLYVDSNSHTVYILDREQGLVSASLDSVLKGGPVKSQELKVLLGGCQNIASTSYAIYLTCPELVQINRQTKVTGKITHNSFYPYKMSLIGERLFLYGHQEMAVYDIFGNVVEEHLLQSIYEQSFTVGDYLVSFSDSEASSFLIIAQQQQLHCYTVAEDRVGIYSGSFSTLGLCSEYFQSPKANNQICEISYPFKVKVTNSGLTDYKIYIILVCSWILLMTMIGCGLGIRHHFVHKAYKELIEEQSKEHIEMVPKVGFNKHRNEEVVE